MVYAIHIKWWHYSILFKYYWLIWIIWRWKFASKGGSINSPYFKLFALFLCNTLTHVRFHYMLLMLNNMTNSCTHLYLWTNGNRLMTVMTTFKTKKKKSEQQQQFVVSCGKYFILLRNLVNPKETYSVPLLFVVGIGFHPEALAVVLIGGLQLEISMPLKISSAAHHRTVR